MTRFCAFTLHQRLFAIDADRVREIVVIETLTRVAGSGDRVRGLVNLRGQIVTCLDLGVMLELGPTALGAPLAIVVEDGDEQICIAIERVHDVFELEASAIDPIPATVPPAMAPNLAGAHQHRDQIMLMLDLGRILGTAGAPS